MNQISLIKGPVKKSILLFSIPFFFSNLFQQLYNTIDTLIIGHFLGDLPLAAIATVIAQIVSTFVCILFIYKKAKILIPDSFQFDYDLTMDLCAQGFSMGLMLSIVSIGTVTLQFGINQLGTRIIAAHTTARKTLSLCSLFLGALCSSISTFVSQNRGAMRKDRIIEGIHFVNQLGIVYVCILSVLIYFISNFLVQLISGTKDPYIIQNATMYLRINVPSMIVLVVLLNSRNALQGLGKKVIPLVSSIIELIGKVIFTMMIIPVLSYFGVCLCEPVIWILMTIQLQFSLHKAIEAFH